MAVLHLWDPTLRWDGAPLSATCTVGSFVVDFDQFAGSTVRVRLWGAYRNYNNVTTAQIECRIGGALGTHMLDRDGTVVLSTPAEQTWTADPPNGINFYFDFVHKLAITAVVARPTGRQKVVIDWTTAELSYAYWGVSIEG